MVRRIATAKSFEVFEILEAAQRIMGCRMLVSA